MKLTNIENKAYVATMRIMEPAARAADAARKVGFMCEVARLNFRRRWDEVYTETLAKLKEGEQ
jgi:hypothetical protein